MGIDNLFGGYIENVHPDVIFYQEELATANLKQIFDKYNFKYVFHFAAYAAEGLSPFMRKFNYSNNVLSTVNIVNECIMHDVKRLVYTSSMSVYGHGDMKHNRFDEADKCAPIDPYGVSKYACEMDIQIAGEQHDLDWCIIRPHNIYGEKQNIWDKYRNVLGIWMNKILHNDDIFMYSNNFDFSKYNSFATYESEQTIVNTYSSNSTLFPPIYICNPQMHPCPRLRHIESLLVSLP